MNYSLVSEGTHRLISESRERWDSDGKGGAGWDGEVLGVRKRTL